MSNKLLFAGIIGGLAVALVLAVLFSGAATAQMMQHQSMQQGFPTHQGMKGSMFKANGLSMVQDVRISGIAITSNNEVSVNLTYTGNGSAPSVTVVVMTNHEQMMGMMGGSSMGGMGGMMMGSGVVMGMNNMGMMSGQNMAGTTMPGWHHPEMPSWNATQWQHWHSQMTAHMAAQSSQMQQSQSGSTVVENGWQTGGNAVTITLDGDTSVHNASDIHVTVFPHLT